MSLTAPNRALPRPQHCRAGIVLVILAVFTGITLLVTPRPALAGRVHFDPDSPAGKEYALPLTQARDENGAGHGDSEDRDGNAATPDEVSLFGVGVGPESASASGGRDDAIGENNARSTATAPQGGREGGDGDGSGAHSPESADTAGYSFSSGLLLVLVLTAGAIGVGVGLRRLGGETHA